MSGHVVLRNMIDELAQLDGMAVLTAEETAPLVEQAMRANAAAGVAPDGTPWAARKKDGGRPMVNAASHITARALAKSVQIVLRGVDVFHHLSKSTPRPVIPTKGSALLPPFLRAAMLEGANRAFRRLMGGRTSS